MVSVGGDNEPVLDHVEATRNRAAAEESVNRLQLVDAENPYQWPKGQAIDEESDQYERGDKGGHQMLDVCGHRRVLDDGEGQGQRNGTPQPPPQDDQTQVGIHLLGEAHGTHHWHEEVQNKSAGSQGAKQKYGEQKNVRHADIGQQAGNAQRGEQEDQPARPIAQLFPGSDQETPGLRRDPGSPVIGKNERSDDHGDDTGKMEAVFADGEGKIGDNHRHRDLRHALAGEKLKKLSGQDGQAESNEKATGETAQERKDGIAPVARADGQHGHQYREQRDRGRVVEEALALDQKG